MFSLFVGLVEEEGNACQTEQSDESLEGAGSPAFLFSHGYWLSDQFETHAEDTVLVVGADNPESTYFGSVAHVLSDAETFVVIAYLYDAYGIGRSFGQPLHVEPVGGLGLRDELGGYLEVSADDFIHSRFYAGDVLRRGSGGERVIELAFLAFDVCRNGSPASEKAYHGLIDDVFAGVHGRVFLLVVCVELSNLFHVFRICRGQRYEKLFFMLLSGAYFPRFLLSENTDF